MIDVFDEGTLTFETSVGLDETPFRYSMVCHICVWRPASDFPHHCAMEKSWTVLGWSHRDYHRDDGQKLIVYPQINSLLFSKVENYDNFQSRKHVMFIEKKEKHRSLVCSIFIFQPFFHPKLQSSRGHGRSARCWNRGAMFTPLMASAAGYAATAYFYNLGRFKFDAEQRQDCIYQIQNMRLVSGLKGITSVTCWGPHFDLDFVISMILF